MQIYLSLVQTRTCRNIIPHVTNAKLPTLTLMAEKDIRHHQYPRQYSTNYCDVKSKHAYASKSFTLRWLKCYKKRKFSLQNGILQAIIVRCVVVAPVERSCGRMECSVEFQFFARHFGGCYEKYLYLVFDCFVCLFLYSFGQ